MRVHDGKITEHWGVANLFSLLKQLGAWPPGAGKYDIREQSGRRFG